MNFYKHHVGDYDADTGHLTWLEDAAYRRLLSLYYRREQPIPADIAQAARLVRAQSKQEREAVESVLREFFVLRDDGWHNKRADEEIRIASAKAERNRSVGKLGGRPPRSATQIEPNGNPDGFQTATQTEPTQNPSQTPDSRLQTPDKGEQRTLEGSVRALVGKALKAAGLDLSRVNTADPRIAALIEAGATPEEFGAIAAEAVERGIARPVGWICATLQARRNEAAAVTLRDAAPKPSEPSGRLPVFVPDPPMTPEQREASRLARERALPALRAIRAGTVLGSAA